MHVVDYIDRNTKKRAQEKVYKSRYLSFFYPSNFFLKILVSPVVYLTCRLSWFSRLYGWTQRFSASKKKIAPFVKTFDVDMSDFPSIESYRSFDDFFTRKLLPNARSIPTDSKEAVVPADGRYTIIPQIQNSSTFTIKGQKFDLTSFLNDQDLAQEYDQGTLVIARLAPCDYHRFHFPVSGKAGQPKLINGPLFSVHPIYRQYRVLTENKRMITPLVLPSGKQLMFIEIGATNVGSIHQTFTPNTDIKKGDEKGFFSFGASAIAVLFPKDTIEIASDLVQGDSDLEIYAQFGQSLGRLKD